MRNKEIVLLLLIPLSEAKALFYSSNEKVSWFLFSNHKRYLCNVIEDYSNIVIFAIIFYYMAFVKPDLSTKSISLFLFILNALDLIHLGLMDMQYFIIAKLLIAFLICKLSKKYLIF